ncbi:HI1506-related protein [Vulcaniibacterium tengchongense]|uniref:Mu-like prophage FluMu N-terminal domain-containing protein n=1 Tax=Vulcaniibacterium tengchongense TaxID=1273429 RepID=A0A3N4VFP8_9GAMM|nr:HI1506-related protein [Vulcaniibacterium tengchongense]RPE81842.1 hypothetical protein EDC50_1044 [Vulcaniibacterium tengchongense]
MPSIKIRSTHEPYRRCGVSHSRAPVIYPADRFDAKQLEILKADPYLVVEEVEDETEAAAERKAAAERETAAKAAAGKKAR